MRHRKAGRKLNRPSSHRRALLSNLVNQLVEHERICTTDAKAKELRTVTEKMVSLAKRGDLHARRLAFSFMRQEKTTQKLFNDIAKRFQDRDGGYTCIVKLRKRKGDGAPLSLIEFINTAAKGRDRDTKAKGA